LLYAYEFAKFQVMKKKYSYKTPSYMRKSVMGRTSSKDKTVNLDDIFLVNWQVALQGKRSFYLRDSVVHCLLVNYSKKGNHSFAYDYRSGTVHKSKVFGYFPSMTVDEARLKAQEIQKRCIEEGLEYDELFEVHRFPSVVYFLQSDNMIKIGKSNDIWVRMRDLVGSQEGVHLLGMREQTKCINESKLHHVYGAFRQKGNEYFSRNPFLIEFIYKWCVARASDGEITKLLTRHKDEIYHR
tara:strand:- start:2491 stop:3210 length:720 start_codon:yes stop_codon:yes gene_type:complete